MEGPETVRLSSAEDQKTGSRRYLFSILFTYGDDWVGNGKEPKVRECINDIRPAIMTIIKVMSTTEVEAQSFSKDMWWQGGKESKGGGYSRPFRKFILGKTVVDKSLITVMVYNPPRSETPEQVFNENSTGTNN